MTFRPITSHSGFTLVELIVGMTIFAIGLTGIYGLLSSVMKNANYSRHEVVVANLLREQNELFHNIRDTNVRNYAKWDTFLAENA
jgi:prepilin-type N-terminal cleavage/methylation domain-containing protein